MGTALAMAPWTNSSMVGGTLAVRHCTARGGWEVWGPPELGTHRICHFPSREKRATPESRFVATSSSVGGSHPHT